jgi:hypothetical protein
VQGRSLSSRASARRKVGTLSKRYLRGKTTDAPFAEDAAFYRDHHVEVLLETTVNGVDAGSPAGPPRTPGLQPDHRAPLVLSIRRLSTALRETGKPFRLDEVADSFERADRRRRERARSVRETRALLQGPPGK